MKVKKLSSNIILLLIIFESKHRSLNIRLKSISLPILYITLSKFLKIILIFHLEQGIPSNFYLIFNMIDHNL